MSDKKPIVLDNGRLKNIGDSDTLIVGDVDSSGDITTKGLIVEDTATIQELTVSSDLNIVNLTVTGNSILGNATSDTITFNGRVASNIVASTDNARTLGSFDLRFNDINTANLSLRADNTNTVKTILNASSLTSSGTSFTMNTALTVANSGAGPILTLNNTGAAVGEWNFRFDSASTANLIIDSAWDEFHIYLDTDNLSPTGLFALHNNVSAGSGGTPDFSVDLTNGVATSRLRVDTTELRGLSGTTTLTLRTNLTTDTINFNGGGTAWTAWSLSTAEVRCDLNASRTSLAMRATGSSQHCAIVAGTSGSGIILGTNQTDFRSANTATTSYAILTHAAAMTMVLSTNTTSFTWSHAQTSAGAGGNTSFSAQRGASGQIGGKFTVAAGQGGTLGTNLAGGIDLDVGQAVASNNTSLLRVVAGATGSVGEHSRDTSSRYLIAGGSASTGGVALSGASLNMIASTTPSVTWRGIGENVSRIDSIPHDGYCSMTWAETVLGITYTQSDKTTDSLCADTIIKTQTPYNLASFANRSPGNLIFRIPAAAEGGNEGRLSVELGGEEVFNYSISDLGFGFDTFNKIYSNRMPVVNFISTSDPDDAGMPFVLFAGSANSAGSRQEGGSIQFKAGDADGYVGDGASGGTITFEGGQGSTGAGVGGSVVLNGGNGGDDGGDGGNIVLNSGSGNGGGQDGFIYFAQSDNIKHHIDRQGVFHIGSDADTTNVNLRINGLTTTSVGAAGGADPLPLTPELYLRINIKGTELLIPTYLTAP